KAVRALEPDADRRSDSSPIAGRASGRPPQRAGSQRRRRGSTPLRSPRTTASAESGPQAARHGRAANTFSFGSASSRPHQALSGVSAKTPTPQDALAVARASSGLAAAVSSGAAPKRWRASSVIRAGSRPPHTE